MVTVLLLGSNLLQVRSIICDPTWSKSDPSWRPVSISESVIAMQNFLKDFYSRLVISFHYKCFDHDFVV